MFKYLQTTTLILGWCFLLSVLWAVVCFYWTSLHRRKNKVLSLNQTILPSLVLGPILLVVFYNIASVNLIFPVQLLSSFSQLLWASFVPAVVLIFASGLFAYILQVCRKEFCHWQKKPFVALSLAKGASTESALRKLIILKTLGEAWSQCLPWLFGELIIVEAIFNAPGIGLDTWNMAKLRNFDGLLSGLFWLACLYVVCVLFSAILNRWLGRRLESYA